jgi:hypothetical protein
VEIGGHLVNKINLGGGSVNKTNLGGGLVNCHYFKAKLMKQQKTRLRNKQKSIDLINLKEGNI